MSNEYVEIPDKGRPESLGAESFGPVDKLNRGLYLAVIVILGGVLVIGVVGWLLLAFSDRTMPEALGVILGTVAGGLVALISTSGGSSSG
jgi:hypothetical protein